jgi:hypothetical protein
MSIEAPSISEESMNSVVSQQFEAGAKEQLFAQQTEGLGPICADSEHGLETFLQSLSPEDYEALFGQDQERGDSISACVDEGVSPGKYQQGRLRIAGSGVLLGKERAQQLWKMAGITTVTAHQGCGAAALYCQRFAPDQADSSQYVAGLLKQWAEEVGLKFEYITQLDRPDFHTARAVSIVTSQDFRPNQVKSMPKTFIVSAVGSSEEVANDAILSAQIALGDHGFADQFSPDQPLMMALIGSPNDQVTLEQIKQQIEADPWFIANQDRLQIQNAVTEIATESELPQAA